MLTNNAFREIMQQGGKTTREIAREAVEQEFQRNQKKRKRRGGGNHDDSSDEDNDNSKKKPGTKREMPQHQQEWDQKLTNQPQDDSTISSSNYKYRDRAKERREGKSSMVDHPHHHHPHDPAGTTINNNLESLAVSLEDDMTQYLGGDEQHTHFVRGLDIALTRRIKTELKKKQQQAAKTRSLLSSHQQPHLVLEDEDKAPSIALHSSQEKHGSEEGGVQTITIPESASQAREAIQKWTLNDVSSNLGREMLEYLKQRYLPKSNHDSAVYTVGSAGLAIQRSYFTFSCLANPGDIRNAWQVPDEHTSMDSARLESDETTRGVLSDPTLLLQIQRAFDRRRNNVGAHPPSPSQTDANPLGKTTKSFQASAKQSDNPDDASDDDIFANAGEYDPLATSNTNSQYKTKGSTFVGLLPQEPKKEKNEEISHSFDIIAKIAQKNRAQGVGTSGGDFSEYNGAYGEDGIDADFAGQMEEDDEDNKTKSKKKRKKEESTTGS